LSSSSAPSRSPRPPSVRSRRSRVSGRHRRPCAWTRTDVRLEDHRVQHLFGPSTALKKRGE
jgi:hypothetical protein